MSKCTRKINSQKSEALITHSVQRNNWPGKAGKALGKISLSLLLSPSLLQSAEELLKMLPLWGTIFQKLAKKRSQTRRATRHRHRWRPNRARPKLISLDYACYESGNRVLIGEEAGERGEGEERGGRQSDSMRDVQIGFGAAWLALQFSNADATNLS